VVLNWIFKRVDRSNGNKKLLVISYNKSISEGFQRRLDEVVFFAYQASKRLFTKAQIKRLTARSGKKPRRFEPLCHFTAFACAPG
jgi:hypothetical protein